MKWGLWWAGRNMVNHHGLVVAVIVAVVVVVCNLKCEATRKAAWDVVPPGCMNCTICPYLCHPTAATPPPPPAIPDYPIGGVPPPPPGTLPYPSDVVPPPPPSNCTTIPVQCCQYTPPMGRFGGYQPQPVTPPSGYGYQQPVGNYSATLLSPPRFIYVVIMVLLLLCSTFCSFLS